MNIFRLTITVRSGRKVDYDNLDEQALFILFGQFVVNPGITAIHVKRLNP
jgi:hypothetical protein